MSLWSREGDALLGGVEEPEPPSCSLTVPLATSLASKPDKFEEAGLRERNILTLTYEKRDTARYIFADLSPAHTFQSLKFSGRSKKRPCKSADNDQWESAFELEMSGWIIL